MTIDLVTWARTEAARLGEEGRRRVPNDTGALGVTASDRRPETASAMEFLSRNARGSRFVEFAEHALAEEYYDSAAILAVARQLENWAEFVEQGLAASLPYEAQSRIDAATDLMEQVQALLDDSAVIPAAPVMLAGAALEEFLRSLLATTTEAITGSPSLTKYASALRRANLLNANDEKDVIAMAGTRNDAAHGNFDLIDAARARLMADQVNLFIRQKSPVP